MSQSSKNVGVNLELSEKEARVLLDVLNRVGGKPEKSYRGITQEIALNLANTLDIETDSKHPTVPNEKILSISPRDVGEGYIHYNAHK